jgi:hypothetical protein
MSERSTRFIISLLTLFTAAVHGIVLNMQMGHLDPLFTLNGLGYLALLVALLYRFPANRQVLLHYAFMGFALTTILAWVAIGERTTLGYTTKLVEVLLVIFLYLNLGRVRAGEKAN